MREAHPPWRNGHSIHCRESLMLVKTVLKKGVRFKVTARELPRYESARHYRFIATAIRRGISHSSSLNNSNVVFNCNLVTRHGNCIRNSQKDTSVKALPQFRILPVFISIDERSAEIHPRSEILGQVLIFVWYKWHNTNYNLRTMNTMQITQKYKSCAI